MRLTALLALVLPLAAVAAPDAPSTPQTVALVAAIGDRVDVVRQLKLSSGRIEPYRRKTLQVSGQALNYAVLRGLDKALTDDEPDARHVLLQWEMPADVADKLAKASGSARQDIVISALVQHLSGLPERQGWDRIEVIVPAYSDLETQGLGSKLGGIGIYVQPLAPQDFDMDGMANGESAGMVTSEADGDYRTVNPRTGETAHASTFVAPYMVFERLSFDAKSMALIKRERHVDHTKYADPDSTALDVGSQMNGTALIGKLVESVERSAYRSIRPVTQQVTVSQPKVVAPPASAAAGR
ncbi:hypothetical protein [Pelomonas cellulosilytica]|uniref:DUF1194 domain-containing protein n=1 Tax=Pelomonas cellulosilytica TaxID=2906762 RepID=A0ABS8XQV0_9BURK|nr:hypothetical protein [Pelomonas sp. P8]MCE4554090.1 hypothetical protein [Pelomonas sp. P8]